MGHDRTVWQRTMIGMLLCLGTIGTALAQPANDDCEDATAIGLGLFTGNTTGATQDGSSYCDTSFGGPDVWFSLTREEAGTVFVETPHASYGVVLSAQAACGGPELVCSVAVPLVGQRASLSLAFEGGETFWLRVATQDFGNFPAPGPYTFRVARGGTLAGTVTDTGGQPLADVNVLLTSNGGASRTTTTAADGSYAFGDLPSRSYLVYAGRAPYVAEAWDDMPCPLLDDCPPGTPIEVELDQVVEGIDFMLALGAAITGTVTDDETGQPLADLPITLDNGERYTVNGTDEEGVYRFEGLGGGTYTVRSDISEAFRAEQWDDIACSPFRCDPAEGTPIVVALGETAAGIDLALDRGATITGRLTDSTTQQPIAYDRVHLFDTTGSFVALGRTDGNGDYALTRINPGTYLVGTDTDDYINELWDDVPCGLGGDCPLAAASPISVDLDQPAAGIDFALAPGGTIRGQVRDAATADVLDDALVDIYDAAGTQITVGFGSSNGLYEVGGLVTGTYFALAYDRDGAYAPELFDDIPCPDAGCDVTVGTPIQVVAGQTSTVDFALDKAAEQCVADAFTLCLNDGRFAIRTEWRTPLQETGHGHAVALDGRDDSGYFWFFSDRNIELVVKVLDACVDPFQHFWVFAAGLTNVEVTMTVTDLTTGELRHYTNPLGQRFQPIQDTRAFETCGVQGAADAPPSPGALLGDLTDLLAAAPGRPAPVEVDPVPAGQPGTCTPSATALCLGDGGRFQVDARWRTPVDATGDAMAVPVVDDTGLFWFFNPHNVELVVKVLSNCGGPTNRFWVFASGLTNVEVDLTVTDTATGQRITYHNPLGVPFVPIQDTQAFATCP